MKIDELKQYIVPRLYNIIDGWFDTQSMQDRFINGTLKTIIQANINKYDYILSLFGNENGDIDLSLLKEEMKKTMQNRYEMDVKELTSKWNIPSFLLPNKVLLITRDELMELLPL